MLILVKGRVAMIWQSLRSLPWTNQSKSQSSPGTALSPVNRQKAGFMAKTGIARKSAMQRPGSEGLESWQTHPHPLLLAALASAPPLRFFLLDLSLVASSPGHGGGCCHPFGLASQCSCFFLQFFQLLLQLPKTEQDEKGPSGGLF